jgi:tRNA(fMet)-specific endonuclease VapC
MAHRAKLFRNGGSQAVRLPKDCRFPDELREVTVRRDGRRVVLEALDAWPSSFLSCVGAWQDEISRPAAGIRVEAAGPLQVSVRKFMLDTDTVSYVLRGIGDASRKLLARKPSEVCISAITLAELRFGAEKRRSKKLHSVIESFVSGVSVAPFDAAAAAYFGRVRAGLESRGRPIGVLDAMIGAHAISLGLVLVTNNAKHYSGVPGLRTDNWA